MTWYNQEKDFWESEELELNWKVKYVSYLLPYNKLSQDLAE